MKLVENITDNCPTLTLCTPSEQLMYYMMIFLSDDTLFLHEDIEELLRIQIFKFLEKNITTKFDFDAEVGKINLYIYCQFNNFFFI